jgi:hypothetical protein
VTTLAKGLTLATPTSQLTLYTIKPTHWLHPAEHLHVRSGLSRLCRPQG